MPATEEAFFEGYDAAKTGSAEDEGDPFAAAAD
jgi:hypothetical protein